MKLKLLAALLFLVGSYAFSQTSNVTANIVDSDGNSWNNGTYVVTFVPPVGYMGSIYTFNGSSWTPANYQGNLTNAGVFSLSSIPRNDYIFPSGSKWAFKICPKASSPCSTTDIAITQANQTITSSLILKVPRFPASNLQTGSYGYADGEVAPPPATGLYYFNVNTNSLRIWTGAGFTNADLAAQTAANVAETVANAAQAAATAAQTTANASLPANGCTSSIGGSIVCPNTVTAGTTKIGVSSASTMTSALSTCGSSACDLHPNGPITFTADTTIPVNAGLSFENGGMFLCSAGQTITINSHFRAPLTKVFDSSCNYQFAVGLVPGVYGEWFGAGGIATSSDDTAAFVQAEKAAVQMNVPLVAVNQYYVNTLRLINDDPSGNRATLSCVGQLSGFVEMANGTGSTTPTFPITGMSSTSSTVTLTGAPGIEAGISPGKYIHAVASFDAIPPNTVTTLYYAKSASYLVSSVSSGVVVLSVAQDPCAGGTCTGVSGFIHSDPFQATVANSNIAGGLGVTIDGCYVGGNKTAIYAGSGSGAIQPIDGIHVDHFASTSGRPQDKITNNNVNNSTGTGLYYGAHSYESEVGRNIIYGADGYGVVLGGGPDFSMSFMDVGESAWDSVYQAGGAEIRIGNSKLWFAGQNVWIPLTSVDSSSGGNAVYHYTNPAGGWGCITGTGTENQHCIGRRVMVGGATNATNNSFGRAPFKIVAISASTVTLNNPTAVAETFVKAALAAVTPEPDSWIPRGFVERGGSGLPGGLMVENLETQDSLGSGVMIKGNSGGGTYVGRSTYSDIISDSDNMLQSYSLLFDGEHGACLDTFYAQNIQYQGVCSASEGGSFSGLPNYGGSISVTTGSHIEIATQPGQLGVQPITGTNAFSQNDIKINSNNNILYSAQGIVSGTYQSGITVIGAAGTNCIIGNFNNGTNNASVTLTLTAVNFVAPGTPLTIINGGDSSIIPPTQASAQAGSAQCNGNIVVTTVITGSASTLRPNPQTQQKQAVYLTQNVTVLQPTISQTLANEVLEFYFRQDTTGTRTVTFDATFLGIPTGCVVNPAAGAVTYYRFRTLTGANWHLESSTCTVPATTIADHATFQFNSSGTQNLTTGTTYSIGNGTPVVQGTGSVNVPWVFSSISGAVSYFACSINVSGTLGGGSDNLTCQLFDVTTGAVVTGATCSVTTNLRTNGCIASAPTGAVSKSDRLVMQVTTPGSFTITPTTVSFSANGRI